MRTWLNVAAIIALLAAILVWQLAPRWFAPPHPQRHEMYQRSLANVRTSCEPVKPELESYCREQASALLEFPECDAECVALVRAIRREPRR
jgi:hypothetical protein